MGMLGYSGEVVASVAMAVYYVVFFSKTMLAPTTPPNTSAIFTPLYFVAGVLVSVPVVWVSLAWISAGRAKRSTIFEATGVVGILTFALGFALSAWGFYSFSQPHPFATGIQALNAVLPFFIVGGAAGLLGITFVILEIVTLFSAARVFQGRYFRYAGFGRIFAIVAGIAIVITVAILLLSSIISTLPSTTTTQSDPPTVMTFVQDFAWGIGAFFLVWTIPEVFAFLGFHAIPMDQPPLQVEVAIAVPIGS